MPAPSPANGTPARDRPDAADWLFWAAFWLAAVLVLLKAYYLATRRDPALPDAGFDLQSLAAISYRDVSFAFVTWAIARGALAIARGRRAAERLVLGAFIASAAAACLYAIASVIAFGILGGFLTYALLQLVGNVRMLGSSVSAYLSRRVALGLAGVPLVYVACVWTTTRIGMLQRVPRWSRNAAAVLAIVLWTGLGQWTYGREWATRYDWRIADNAPWVLASSWWRSLGGERTVRLSDRFTADDLADFEAVGQRRPTPIIPPRRLSGRSSRAAARAPRPTNVILVVLESVGQRWTTFGGRYDSTPTLKREAARAVVFDNVYAHVGRSSNSLASILLSVYPKLNFRDFTEEYPLVQRTSIAAVFRDRGYRTAFMTSSDLSWAGWDAFLPSRGFVDVRDDHALACSEQVSSWGVEDRCLVDGLIDYIGREPGKPFFAMGWTQQTHHPYEPSPGTPLLDLVKNREPVPDEYDLQRYLNVMHETDRQLGRLFDAVRGRPADDTMIVVVGDHGQAFGYPHDSYLQGRTAYEEDVHVPMMIWSPRRYRTETHAPVVGGHVDLAVTIADLAGVPAAPDWQGRNLLNPTHPPRAYFYVAQDEFKLGVRENEWKYIYDLRAGTDELYNLATDPDEQRRVTTEPERADRLRQHLAAWAEANRRQYERLPSR